MEPTSVDRCGSGRAAIDGKPDRQADQQIAGMRDRRIGQQAADVLLPECRQVAQRHRDQAQSERQVPGDAGQFLEKCVGPARIVAGHAHRHDSHQGRQARDLGHHGQHPRVGMRRSLVHVRGVKVKRHRVMRKPRPASSSTSPSLANVAEAGAVVEAASSAA